MEAIAADKHKLSMEGLLKIEEKMQRIETGLNRDKTELVGRVDVLNGDFFAHHCSPLSGLLL